MTNERGYVMIKKLLIGIAAVIAVSLLASCDVSTDDPLASPSANEYTSAEQSVLEQSDVSVSVEESDESILIDESSEEENSGSISNEPSAEISEDTSSEESEEISYPEPTFGGGEVKPLMTPEEEGIPIRTLVQNEKDTLEYYGDIDLNDPETADAIAQIQALIDSYDKDFAFFAYSLDGSRAITFNCEETYFSACTIKASYMLYCCLAIDQGLASKNEVMYYQEKYKHGGSGVIKNSEYGTPYTLEQLIGYSLSVSDNIAFKMLYAYFGVDGYNEMMTTLGVERLKLSASSVWNRQMNARDLSIIWREIYFYFQTETPMSKLYYRNCTNTAYNYATRYIDEKYSHKSGDTFPPDAVCNDGALVWKDIPYVVATMNRSEDEQEDRDVVCGIVKIINDVLMKNNDLPEEE